MKGSFETDFKAASPSEAEMNKYQLVCRTYREDCGRKPHSPHISVGTGPCKILVPTMQALALSRETSGKLGMNIDKCLAPRSPRRIHHLLLKNINRSGHIRPQSEQCNQKSLVWKFFTGILSVEDSLVSWTLLITADLKLNQKVKMHV